MLAKYQTPGIGDKPVAELRGWGHLLTGDTAAAIADARQLREFVASIAPTDKDKTPWHLRMLAADGALFAGNKAQALVDARASAGAASAR